MCLARMAQALDVSNAAAIQLNQRLGALDIAETLPEAMAEILEGLRPEEAFIGMGSGEGRKTPVFRPGM